MSQNFSVNGKEYIQSSTLAADFGYTSDYIGKLARDEKIIGTQVGRQWFIEPESLKLFLHKSNIEKDIRKQELSKKRKREHETHQEKIKIPVRSKRVAFIAGAQAVVVVLCGLFIGGLGWITHVENVHISDVTSSVSELGGILKGLAVRGSVLKELYENPLAFVSDVESTASLSQVGTEESMSSSKYSFAELPVEKKVKQTDEVENVDTLQMSSVSITSNFSDEVDVVVDEEGNEFIAPVFRSQASSSMLFMLVPVTDKKQ